MNESLEKFLSDHTCPCDLNCEDIDFQVECIEGTNNYKVVGNLGYQVLFKWSVGSVYPGSIAANLDNVPFGDYTVTACKTGCPDVVVEFCHDIPDAGNDTVKQITIELE